MRRPDVRLHIDRLVLDPAFGHLDREAVGAAVAAELGRLIREHGAPSIQRGSRIARLDPGQVGLPDGAGANAVGKHVARRLHEGLEL